MAGIFYPSCAQGTRVCVRESDGSEGKEGRRRREGEEERRRRRRRRRRRKEMVEQREIDSFHIQQKYVYLVV